MNDVFAALINTVLSPYCPEWAEVHMLMIRPPLKRLGSMGGSLVKIRFFPCILIMNSDPAAVHRDLRSVEQRCMGVREIR
jgi:hypothetical protein